MKSKGRSLPAIFGIRFNKPKYRVGSLYDQFPLFCTFLGLPHFVKHSRLNEYLHPYSEFAFVIYNIEIKSGRENCV